MKNAQHTSRLRAQSTKVKPTVSFRKPRVPVPVTTRGNKGVVKLAILVDGEFVETLYATVQKDGTKFTGRVLGETWYPQRHDLDQGSTIKYTAANVEAFYPAGSIHGTAYFLS